APSGRAADLCVPTATGTAVGGHAVRLPDRTLVPDRDTIRPARRSGTVVVPRAHTGDSIAVPAVLLPEAVRSRIGS
ncbi:hypothetical protein ACLXNF_19230, partial [Mycobacteroides chelonae]|uniref:hypothetical protein n=1 Tax=Mycobacteroides chelonae TaxID=1774 RepID=UPI0039E789A0